jgi:hypothetical protein
MRYAQIFICIVTTLAFICLAVVSRNYVHEEHGYTKSEIRQHDSLLASSVKQVVTAENNRQTLGIIFQTEPDGSPVELFHAGRKVQ